MMYEDRYMMRAMRKDRYNYMMRPQQRKKPIVNKRLVDPKYFREIYDNPLVSFMPLLEYFTSDTFKLEQDPQQRSRRLEHERIQERMQGRERRIYDFEEEEEQLTKGVEMISVIRKQPRRSFEDYRIDFLRYLQSNRESMNKSRRANLQFIESHFSVNMRGSDLLNPAILEQKWNRVNAIITKKLDSVDLNFKRRSTLLGKLRDLDAQVVSLLNERKEFKGLNNFDAAQQSTVLRILIFYLALPVQEILHQELLSLQEGTKKVLRGLSGEQDQLKRVLVDLPYKESSFYWEKILDCCRNITECDHPSGLDRARVQQFEAEFAGTVTQETLKKLKSGEWLDNTITSAVIEYLRQIQGANNYHGDSNYRACIFTHSETGIFMNSQRDMGENYIAYEKLIFLVNHENIHWFVIVAYLNRRQIVVYDSLSSNPAIYNDYCGKIEVRLRKMFQRNGKDVQFKAEQQFTSPSQSNTSDCGIFSIANLIWAFDRPDPQSNRFSSSIAPQLRHSLFLLLLYLGYCRQQEVVPRKDYFDLLFRSTIYSRLQSRLHIQRSK